MFSQSAKYLTAYFEGYFMCRIATDPDPTDEKRGLSGYTMALVGEDVLDQVIRLQVGETKQKREEFLQRNLRPPADDMRIKPPAKNIPNNDLIGKKQLTLRDALEKGVWVRSVTFDGKPYNPQHGLDNPLVGARVSLLGDDKPFKGAIFEGRNNITGSGDNFAFIIDPFHLQLHNEDADITICAKDILNPAKPNQKIWEMLEPTIYGRRLSNAVEEKSLEVAEAINVIDFYGYFSARRRYLQKQIELNKNPDCKTKEQFKSRLYQLDFWGDRVISKLGTKVSWSFNVNEFRLPNCLKVQDENNLLGGKIDKEQPWPVQFWFGGWDGDLLVGYMRGSLSMPFTPGK